MAMLPTFTASLLGFVLVIIIVSCVSTDITTCSEDVAAPPQTVLDRLCLDWRFQFYRYDLNRNGRLERSDLEYVKRRTLPYVRWAARDAMVTWYANIWAELLHDHENVFLKDYLQTMANQYQFNRPALVDTWRNIWTWQLLVLDLDGDHVISQSEMVIYFRIAELDDSQILDVLPSSVKDMGAQFLNNSTETGMTTLTLRGVPSEIANQHIGSPSADIRQYMEKLRQQWAKLFDVNDVNRNGQLERSDLNELKSKSSPCIPTVVRFQMNDLQDYYWLTLLQSRDLDVVVTKNRFQDIMSGRYQVEGTEFGHRLKLLMRYFEQAFVDTDGDRVVSKEELRVAAFVFGTKRDSCSDLEPGKAARLVTVAKKTDQEPASFIGDFMIALTGG